MTGIFFDLINDGKGDDGGPAQGSGMGVQGRGRMLCDFECPSKVDAGRRISGGVSLDLVRSCLSHSRCRCRYLCLCLCLCLCLYLCSLASLFLETDGGEVA